MPMAGIKPRPPAQQANALSITPLPLGKWGSFIRKRGVSINFYHSKAGFFLAAVVVVVVVVVALPSPFGPFPKSASLYKQQKTSLKKSTSCKKIRRNNKKNGPAFCCNKWNENCHLWRIILFSIRETLIKRAPLGCRWQHWPQIWAVVFMIRKKISRFQKLTYFLWG